MDDAGITLPKPVQAGLRPGQKDRASQLHAFTTSDGVTIWFNGTLVHDRRIRRLSRRDDQILPLRLRAGKNQLLIKIQNVSGGWNFITALHARDPR